MRTLSLRDLNRATLARQLLLERRRLSALAAIERLVGMQAQWPPAPYVGLWARVAGFRRSALERAVRRGDVVKPTVMRGTLHLVTARDYPLFYAAFREMNTWFGPMHLELAVASLPSVLALARDDRIAYAEILTHLRKTHPELEERDWRRMVHAVRRHAHLLHARETAVWTTRPSATYELVEAPAEVDVREARTEIVRRYLRAFGPATKADVADWSGLRVRDFEHALDGLPTHRGEDGRTLYDVPRAPLPDGDTAAPVRFLPKWDNCLLGYANRTRVISDEIRKQVIGKNGDVAQTVLVDGFVAATWSADPNGKVTVQPFSPLPRVWRREVEDEAARLEAWLS
ncbi:MAG TPA: winged helix DNA-binding domain-containing protein [Gaiellaceae bacterium]|nr:winged helix DNA-binding domain-containing protein [Gaiellaceae bacterium]